jgi:N-acetylglucosamine kinase-like BadF-type ATPase
MDLVIGVDGGGSKTLAVLAESSGRELGRGLAGGCNFQVVGEQAARATILTAIRTAFERAELPFKTVAGICMGLAGVGRAADQDWVEDFVREEGLARRLAIAHDGQLLLWAGTPLGWGVGIVSGTGSIAYGRSPDGREARAGGWGYLLGDEGSGYAIGRAALQAVAQAEDERGPATTLTGRVLAQWKLDQPSDLVRQVYQGGKQGRIEIAALAEVVLEEAASGDEVAAAIETRAARELALQAAAVIRRLGFSGEVPCALGGGVLTHSDRLVEHLLKMAGVEGIELQPVQRVTEPVRGAVRLAIEAISGD